MGVITIRQKVDPAVTRALRTEIRQRRERRRILLQHAISEKRTTQTKLALEMGCSVSYISRIITGARVPGLDFSIRMAAALDMGLQEFADIIVPPAVRHLVDQIPDTRLGTLPSRITQDRYKVEKENA